MKKAKKVMWTLLGLLLVSVVALVGVILYAEYSGKRFLPGEKENVSLVDFPEDESRLVYDENGNIPELPGVVTEEAADGTDAAAGDEAATTEGTDAAENAAASDEQSASDGQDSQADADAGADEAAAEQAVHTYIMNKESSIFHYDTCPDVQNIGEENRLSMTADRETVMSRGYDPCQNCNP